MASCSAYNCSNKIGANVEGITFHRFPLSKPDLLMKWLSAMRKDKWVPNKADVLCSFHFADDQFVENNGYRFLVPAALPSRFEVLAPPKSLFPGEWGTRLLTIRDIECDNRKGFVVEARVALGSREAFTEWLGAHERRAQVSYVLLRNYPLANKNLSYKAEYVCVYGSATARTNRAEKPCPARLLVRIRTDPKFRHSRPAEEGQQQASVAGYPCNVVLYHLHGHHVGSNSVETQLGPGEEVSSVVKQKFLEMFKGGYSPEEALAAHRRDLLEEYADESDEVLGDAYVCPPPEWLAAFHAASAAEFAWDEAKRALVLREEVEDVCASRGSAAAATTEGGDTVVVLCTPLMQRAHSMKAAGEVVFVDSSVFLERCRCHVFLIMAYSCTEGLPLGLLLATSDAEETLAAGFRLLADALPEKAFGSFGRQGPEVFLTAHSDALQRGLQAVYPESAVLLCAHNMSRELWRWLWDPENGVEEADRCALFADAYRIMQAKSAEEFEERNGALMGSEAVRRHERFGAHFAEIRAVSDRWAVCFKNEMLDRDREISGIEMASHVLRDRVFLTRAYNLPQLLRFYADGMEAHYRQKIVHCIGGTLEPFLLASFPPEMREASDLVVRAATGGGPELHEVRSAKSGKAHFVHAGLCVCSCGLGLSGARCKHQYAVRVARGAAAAESHAAALVVPDDDVIKRELFWIATGTMKTGAFDVQQAEYEGEGEGEGADLAAAPSPSRGAAGGSQKEESRKILERVVRNIMQKYDANPAEFHKAIVTAAVNYQNLNNDREVLAALKYFGKSAFK